MEIGCISTEYLHGSLQADTQALKLRAWEQLASEEGEGISLVLG